MKLTTPPLAPKVIAALQALGIETLAGLQAADPCRAFLLLKKSGLNLTLSVFWQLVALCSLKNVHELSETERAFWQQQLRDTLPVAVFPPPHYMQQYMAAALLQAQQAAVMGEVPVGAVVVKNGSIIAQAHNRCISDCRISSHAEIGALAAAAKVSGSYRLSGCDVYVSLEPCVMCAGALIQARVARVIFAAAETKTGAAGSVLNVFADKRINAHTAVLGGVLAAESQALLQDFFQQRR